MQSAINAIDDCGKRNSHVAQKCQIEVHSRTQKATSHLSNSSHKQIITSLSLYGNDDDDDDDDEWLCFLSPFHLVYFIVVRIA